uniref:Uncharacterized protein n=1 Tax=Nothoprocta perdicaria TaxID=30464 RepID=A0A8C6YWK8_NOTPE
MEKNTKVIKSQHSGLPNAPWCTLGHLLTCHRHLAQTGPQPNPAVPAYTWSSCTAQAFGPHFHAALFLAEFKQVCAKKLGNYLFSGAWNSPQTCWHRCLGPINTLSDPHLPGTQLSLIPQQH